jgi:predicted ATP-dependent protease
MDPDEIRAIRGSLSRAAFARLLGVTALTVLRWELPEGSKEARRPRAKMIETLRRVAAGGVAAVARESGEEDEGERDADACEPAGEAQRFPVETLPDSVASSDQAMLEPLLERLATEGWLGAENQLLSLLSTGALATNEGRSLATLGIVHAQLFGRFDLRGALTNLLPILEEAERGRLSRAVAARAHVLTSLLFSSPDVRFFDPGRVNAHVARAQALLHSGDPGTDDLHAYLATASVYSARYLGPHVLMRTYQAHAAALARASSPLAALLAEALHHLAWLIAEGRAASARREEAYLERAERLRMPYVQVALFLALAQQAISGVATPEEILGLVKDAQSRAQAGGIAPTEELLRLHRWEIEANIRLARFADAEAAYRNALDAARRGGIPAYPLVPAGCHLFALLNRGPELEAIADQLEAEGPPRAGPNYHAFFARALACFVAGELARAVELMERVCAAPETAPGIDDLRHHAYFGLLVLRVASGDPAHARAASHRFQVFLEERPSVWHSVVHRRLSGLALFFEGRLAEARQTLESVLPAFRLLGDVTELALTELDLAAVARSSGAPDGDERIAAAVAALESLGVPQTLGLRRIAQARVHAATWSEPTMSERLVIAMDRLSVRGLRPDQFRGEIESIVSNLCPGRAVSVGTATPDDVARDGVDVPDGEGGLLRVRVDGPLGAEQLAALRILQALVAGSAALLAPREPEAVSDPSLPQFIAVAQATRRLKREIAQLSKSNATILITGESGSGKEVVARGVHELSSRADKAYIAFNCASVPRDLFEGQLFGYKKGAFTSATSDNPGVIRAADGGTLFLDEIAELPLDTQPKLLRFLENGEIFPLGEQKPRRVDVRVLAATHRDLARSVREGRFREDLFYRLNVVPLAVPPLRERVDDVVPLARMFLERLAPEGQERPELGADAIAVLERYLWPGNVRELRNVIERAMAYAPVPSVLRAEHLRIGSK